MSRCRKNIRLKDHDYSSNGLYFVTICTSGRRCSFGHVLDRCMVKNDIGEIAEKLWIEIPIHFPFVSLDNYIVMPNHVHGILILKHNPPNSTVDIKCDHVCPSHDMSIQITGDENVGPRHFVVTKDYERLGNSRHNCLNQFSKPISGSLSVIVNQYKAAVKRWCNANNHPEFAWQPRFYDRIINDPDEYVYVRDYITGNPLNWENDDLFG
jgi:putative transposase